MRTLTPNYSSHVPTHTHTHNAHVRDFTGILMITHRVNTAFIYTVSTYDRMSVYIVVMVFVARIHCEHEPAAAAAAPHTRDVIYLPEFISDIMPVIKCTLNACILTCNSPNIFYHICTWRCHGPASVRRWAIRGNLCAIAAHR